MLKDIQGLHHVTAMARDAQVNNHFFTRTLGLRRVKTTVNFDEPSVYHLYYGDEVGRAGTVMTHFPFPHIVRGRPGSGEVGETAFSVPGDSLDFWDARLAEHGFAKVLSEEYFGQKQLRFQGPEGDALALVALTDDKRPGWDKGPVAADAAVRGFHSVVLRLRDAGATRELLEFMGYERVGTDRGRTRFALSHGNGADLVDLHVAPDMPRGDLGAGSVHHVAFAVADRAAQDRVRAALVDTGYAVTPSIDRDYFQAVYFRTPGGVLFEIATNEPGFERDEDRAHLGDDLKLPAQHEHLRSWLQAHLPNIEETVG